MCIYNRKALACVCVSYLDKYISATTWPPKQKFL